MAKMRVHELAKELNRPNKDIIKLLTDKGAEIKSHMSMLEEDQVEWVRKMAHSIPVNKVTAPIKEGTKEKIETKVSTPAEKKETEKPQEATASKAEPPKKKNITRIFRSQNSRTGVHIPAGMRGGERPGRTHPAQAGQRPEGTRMPSPQDRRPVGETQERPASNASHSKTETAANQASTQRPTANASAPASTGETTATRAQERPAAQASQPAEHKNFGDRTGGGESKPYGDRTGNGERRPFGDRNGSGERKSYGDRNGNGERKSYGDRAGNGERRPYGDRTGNGERRTYGDRTGNGERRPFGDRTGNGERRSFGDRTGSGERRSFGDHSGSGDRRFQGGQGRPQGGRSMSAPSPDMNAKPGSKESRMRNDKDKDKYNNKRDKFDRQEKGQGRPGKGNNNASKTSKTAGKFMKPVKPAVTEKKEDEIRNVILPDTMTIRELADILKIQPSAIVKKLFLQGTVVTVNHEIDYDMAEEIALEYNCIAEHEVKVDVIEELLKEEEESEDLMVSRPPVVCVMGHVDHGKTSLLDAIRHTHVIAKEAGGITQHIGAYTVSVNGQKITFLDTPGHEAFTAMRMRGANATDIAILVVAADDGVMPQTIEAISHAKAAGTEIIVAINKIDRPNANVDRVLKELADHELVPEAWGGSTVCVPVSAQTHEGIDNLLEMVLLTAEVAELKANPNRQARGLVIEAELDKGKGPVATVLVQKGTLHVGDAVAAGACYGKVRAMIDDKGRRVKEAGPSMPVEILGLSDVPNAGEVFVACENDKEARNFAETFISQNKEKLLEETKARMSLDDLFSQIQAGNMKELNIIVKADVQGSVEAVKQSLVKLSNEEVAVKVIHGGVGAINESDVTLASASNAIIIGFNVRPDVTAKSTADAEKVDIRLYRVIYDAIADVEAAMKGMLDPVYEEKVIGHAEVRQTFKASGVGTIAGSYVLDGMFQRNCLIRITREGNQIYEGSLASLKRFKDDVKEVKAGYECGLVFEKFNDLQELDQVEAYIMVEVPR